MRRYYGKALYYQLELFGTKAGTARTGREPGDIGNNSYNGAYQTRQSILADRYRNSSYCNLHGFPLKV
jgi:hypothetical protein